MKTLLILLFFVASLMAKTYVYECSDNKSFVIQLLQDKALLQIPKGSLDLQKGVSESNTVYTTQGYRFIQDGYEAFLDTPTQRYQGCVNNRYKASWEDARLRGSSFRAVGNEPGWYLEIARSGEKSLLVTEYGREKYELMLSRPQISEENGNRRYSIKGFLEISILSNRCQDTITGIWYPTRVRVKLWDKSYTGCGKALR